VSLKLRPISIKRAQAFVFEHHRHLKKIQGAMWAVSVWTGEELRGVAMVGHAARMLGLETLSVLRVAVIEGTPNACSMLLGACARVAKAMGAENLVTYTLEQEPGTSLRAAGWVFGGMTSGGEHSRKSRPRQAALFPEPKKRWWAAWSERAK